jgi:hypothetical protein
MERERETERERERDRERERERERQREGERERDRELSNLGQFILKSIKLGLFQHLSQVNHLHLGVLEIARELHLHIDKNIFAYI